MQERLWSVVPLLTLLLCGAFPGPCKALGQEVRLLSDFSDAAAWRPDQWNKAAGTVAASDSFPEVLRTREQEPRKSLALAVDWPTGAAFSFFTVTPVAEQPPIPFAVQQVSLWMRGSGTGHGAEVHFADAKGQDVKVGLGALDFTDWRKLRAKIPASFAQPLRFRCVTLHNWGLTGPESVTVWITRLEVVVDSAKPLMALDGKPTLKVQSNAMEGVVAEEGSATLSLSLQAWQPAATSYELRQTLTDWQGKATTLPTLAVELTGPWQQSVPVKLERFGPYSYEAVLLAKGSAEPVARVRTRLVRLAPVERLSASQRAASPIGVNVHYQAHWNTLGRAGVHWARDYSWGWLKHGERAPMADNGVAFAPVWKAADEAGITILPVAMGAFRNAQKTGFLEDAGEIEEGYARLSRAFLQAPYWELDNEAEYGFPSRRFDMSNYENYVAAAARGLRKAGTAQVVLNGTAGIRYEDTLELLKSEVRKDFAVVNYHYYTGSMPPERGELDSNLGGDERWQELGFLDQVRRINQLAHEAGKEAWLTEIGWDVTNGPEVGERLQAVYLPRAYLLARLYGTDKVFWYFDRDVAGSTTKFSTCGLLDGEDVARPSLAALAALSQQTAMARVEGSVDLGPDRWCVLLRKTEGTWVAAVWSVEGDHPWPAELAGCEAVDLFGNPVTPTKITPEVTYCHLQTLPAGWEEQRKAEWLSSSRLSAAPGGSVTVEARSSGEMKWGELPPGVSGAPWQAKGDRWSSRLTCAADLAAGSYAVTALASGPTSQRAFGATMVVRPALQVSAEAYRPGMPARISLVSAVAEPLEVRVSVGKETGTVSPVRVVLQPGQSATVTFTAADRAVGALPLDLGLSSGAGQKAWLRPAELAVPRLEEARVDGSLDEWPQTGVLQREALVRSDGSFAPKVEWSWSSEGLQVAAEIPVTGLQQPDPRSFWDWTNLEVLVDTSGKAQKGWGDQSHQFWFVPVKEGQGWRLYAGEWKRGSAVTGTIYDDARCRTAVRVQEGRMTLEILLPAVVLGGHVPVSGTTWLAAVSLQAVSPTGRASAAWPTAKASGLLDGTGSWGTVRFVAQD
jgi:hypothetical protein